MNTLLGRLLLFVFCIADAALLLLCGWLVPIHICAVDVVVIQQAGEGSTSLADQGLALVRDGRVAAAELLLQAGQAQQAPGLDRLSAAVRLPVAPSPIANRIQNLFHSGAVSAASTNQNTQFVTETVIRLENRDRVLAFLQSDNSPFVRELLRCRNLTNTVLFPPSSSASGQAFDAALSVCGLLLEANSLSAGLRDAFVDRAALANRGTNTEPLEQSLMDMMSLGQRLTWEQLSVFVRRMKDPRTLERMAIHARNATNGQISVLFAAVELSQDPGAVSDFLDGFSETGLGDLGTSLRYGSGALEELLRRGQRICASSLRDQAVAALPVGFFFHAATNLALRLPGIAVTVKWFLYLSGGFLVAVSLRVFRALPVSGEPSGGRGYRTLRELLFASGFLVVVLLLSEPFLAQVSQKVEFPLRLRLPGVASLAAIATPAAASKPMNPPSLLTLLLFFVLQGIIYTVCLAKLAEIRRQAVPAPLRLKLLENEEHLFDAGLYLGFCGTIVSLVLHMMDISQFSLMAGYSSTAFGIIFVSIFKIFHLRPYRRQLLLE